MMMKTIAKSQLTDWITDWGSALDLYYIFFKYKNILHIIM